RSKRDWSSDVCSSDLKAEQDALLGQPDGVLGAAGIAVQNAFRPVLFQQGVDVGMGLPVVDHDGFIQFQSQTDLGLKKGQLGVLRSEERRVGKEVQAAW